jgi:hypothetical protein
MKGMDMAFCLHDQQGSRICKICCCNYDPKLYEIMIFVLSGIGLDFSGRTEDSEIM